MSREELAELQRLATRVQRWIATGNQLEVPIDDIGALARLASEAANVIEFGWKRLK